MVLAAHQPNYLPWAGFFYKMARCDTFVLLDSVQYARRSYTARCLVKGQDGKGHWLSVPVLKTGRYYQNIAEVEIDNQEGWQQRHRRSLESCYARAPYFDQCQWLSDLAFGRTWSVLCQLNIAAIGQLAKQLGIGATLVRSSELAIDAHSNELLVALCAKLGADTYLSGPGGKKYLDEKVFQKAGIELRFVRFWPEPYPQLWGQFVPGLSIVDLLFNCGPEAARRVIAGDAA